MEHYTIVATRVTTPFPGALLTVGFGKPADNNVLVREVEEEMKNLLFPDGGVVTGGGLVLINGPASLPIAVAVAHAVCHRFGVVAVYDPKLGSYVVAISHGDYNLRVGDLILRDQVS